MKASTTVKKLQVSDLAEIRFGIHAASVQEGDAEYLQVRQFNEHGVKTSNSFDFVNIDKKNEGHLLKDGDVLFVGKGNRIFSWCYRKQDRPTFASSIFFVLRLDANLVLPEYLTAILNAPQSKAAFQQIGAGTNILSIRKSELGAFQIPIPSMQRQKLIANVAQLHGREVELAQQIIAQKQNLYTAIISNLIK